MSRAWTLRGIAWPGASPLASAATTCSGSPSESATNASIVASSGSSGRDRPDHRRDPVPVESIQPDALCAVQAGQFGRGRFGARTKVFAPPRKQHEDGSVAQPSGQIGQCLTRRIVGEVQVVHPHHARAAALPPWPPGRPRSPPAAGPGRRRCPRSPSTAPKRAPKPADRPGGRSRRARCRPGGRTERPRRVIARPTRNSSAIGP